ncbi:MAG: FAD-dependent pyridine nucleotide-disulfide oxidoreductase [Pseudonocardiales bacterium]|nr:FAD-dependent pyridine nucleotide-disulfide oxidoreductase [Jatrophihabitantaceae bacterium]MCW2603346.1 FAD-dependent pyridine nucleotide-disulfide oxidoreductase [Pseudonocardiales bacterium]
MARGSARQGRPRVVVIGSGFGGLFATRALAKTRVDITLIDRTTQHLFQPLLYQVATGILSEGEIAPSTRNILKKQRNTRVQLGEVTGIDLAARTVTAVSSSGTTVTEYDELIVAAGSVTSYFGNDHFAPFAPGLKTIDDALELRGRIFGAFEMAEVETDPVERDAWMTFVVVGAGPTGVEMAGQIAELAHRSLRGNFDAIDPKDARIILIDAAPAPLGTFGHKLSAKAAKQIGDLGVELWLNTSIADVDSRGVVVRDKQGVETRIDAKVAMWSAGVGTTPLAKMLAEQIGQEVDRRGRVAVEPDLTLAGHPEVHVVGDMGTRDNLPGVAQVAIQGGRYSADQISRKLSGKAPNAPFKYKDKGSLATVARFRAVAEVGPIRTAGFIAWCLWLGVHLLYLVGFKNRVTTLFHWAVSFVGSTRSERAATLPVWPTDK